MAIDRMKDINVFVHVAEAKSFTAAAERIGLSRSAVGKSIVRLEDRLGVRLLQRTTRSVSLTGEGAAFHERCIRLLADLEEAEMAMLSHSQAPRGRLRLDLPVSFGRLHVLPILNDFMRKWPEISVSASFSDRYVDLIDEGVDIAIRIGETEDSRLMTRLLAPHRLVTCAAPAYLESQGEHSNSLDTDRRSVRDNECGGAARRDDRRIWHRTARDVSDQRRSANRTTGPDFTAR
jgi:DNA-binding transcriptional LysR family regulator